MDVGEKIFSSDLLPNEKIIWTGQPDKSVIFSPIDIFLVPFSLAWGGFAVFWELSALGVTNQRNLSHNPPAFFALFGVPFVVIGLKTKIQNRKMTHWSFRTTGELGI